MKKPSSARGPVEDRHALTLHECISALMRDFRIEPGLLAGSVYADLHANDIGLFEVLAGSESWTVRQIAVALSAPISTISSALDRLEKLGLVYNNGAGQVRGAPNAWLLTQKGTEVERLVAGRMPLRSGT